MLWQLIIFGAVGGAARGLLGYVKYTRSYKNVVFDWKYFVSTAGLSVVVGAGTVWVMKDAGLSFEGLEINGSLALIIGYAGGDAIDNVYKAILGKPTVTRENVKD